MGAALTAYIGGITLHALLVEECAKLGGEIPACVMFGLMLNVFYYCVEIRCTDAECTVTTLPGEQVSRFVHPFRRIRLNHSNGVSQRKLWRQSHHQVHVVLGAANGEQLDSVIARNAVDIRPEVRLDRRKKFPVPFSGGEDYMHVIAGIRVRHVSPLKGL